LATVNSGHVALWTVDGLRVRWQVTPPALAAISATPRTPLLSVTRDVGHADFSPDGRTLAVSSGSQLELIDVGTGSVRWARPTAWYDGSQVGFSGDGRLLANLSAGEIQQVSTTDGAPIGEPLAPQGGISVDFAISGTRIVASSNASPILSVFNLDPNGPLSRTVPDADSSQFLEYDPTGRSLLLLLQAGSGPIFAVTRTFDQRTGSFGPVLPLLAQPRFLEANSVGGMQASFTIGEFDSRTARPVAPSIAVPILHLTNAQFDPRTHRILIANTTGTLDLFSPKGRSLASPWANLGGYPVLSSSGFARNGSIAAFDSNTRSVWVLNSRGRKILHESIDVTMAALSPQGDRLAVLHDQQVDLFDVHTGARIGGAVGVPAGSTDLEFSEDGKRMLVFGQNQGVIVDLGDEQLLGDPFSSVGYLALRPDGDQLATMSDGWITLWNLNSRTWPSAACHAAGRNLTHAEWNYYLPDAGAYGRTCPQWPSGA
jgi:WD40 repeat protein